LTSLDFHKNNDHKTLQLNQKKVNEEEELSYPDSDGDVSSPHKAKRLAKRNLS